MKCPYCGFENEGKHCKKCFAVILVEEPMEKTKETTTKKKRKEMKENGT